MGLGGVGWARRGWGLGWGCRVSDAGWIIIPTLALYMFCGMCLCAGSFC